MSNCYTFIKFNTNVLYILSENIIIREMDKQSVKQIVQVLEVASAEMDIRAKK